MVVAITALLAGTVWSQSLHGDKRLDVFGFPSPQNANYQEFYGGGSTRDWIKPRGASMVRMLLIGAGGGGSGGAVGGGNGTNGGGSGAITLWIGPAIFIPDVLRVVVGAGGSGSVGASGIAANAANAGTASSIIYQAKDGTGYTLLTANGGNGGPAAGIAATGGAASTNNYFCAAGIFKSIAGQSSIRAANLTASTTTFLSAGSGGANSTTINGFSVAANYGYPTLSGGVTGATGGDGNSGFFITQPIMLGVGGSGGGGGSTTLGGNGGNGGIGCGGGGGARSTVTLGGNGGRGGDGAVFIWAW